MAADLNSVNDNDDSGLDLYFLKGTGLLTEEGRRVLPTLLSREEYQDIITSTRDELFARFQNSEKYIEDVFKTKPYQFDVETIVGMTVNLAVTNICRYLIPLFDMVAANSKIQLEINKNLTELIAILSSSGDAKKIQLLKKEMERQRLPTTAIPAHNFENARKFIEDNSKVTRRWMDAWKSIPTENVDPSNDPKGDKDNK